MEIDPRRTALVFPGQGSQHVGMGHALAEEEPGAAQTFALADDILGYPLSDLCWQGPEETLNDTEHTQPALLTHSIAALEVIRARIPDLQAACVAGHSLGEFSALVAAESLSFPEALRLVKERGRLMKDAGQKNPGGMAAVIGLSIPTIEAVCRQVSEASGLYIGIANDNCPGQVVISGHESALLEACEKLQGLGARKVIRLQVSIAAHSPLMEPIQDLFKHAILRADVLDPLSDVYSNVFATPMRSAADVEYDLHSQLTGRVRWTESINAMIGKGIDTFIEVGSGKVLSGLIRRIDRAVQTHAINDPASLANLISTE